MSTPTFTPRNAHPYPDPDLSLPEALAELDRREAAVMPLRPACTPHPVAERPVLQMPEFPPAMFTGGYDLRGVRESMRRRGWPEPRPYPEPEATPIGDVAEARVLGTGPVAVITAARPVAEPATGYAEGVVRGLLISGLWGAADYYGALDPEACADCESDEQLCAFHAPRLVKGIEYEQLHDFAAQAPADSAAIYGVAVAIRTGDAELGDIASPGSPLEGLLLARLSRLDAEAGAR